MIELKDVCKTYKYGKEETKALDNINLTIKDGEFVAVIGNSGSGKSTLLNVIGCMDLMDSGSYILNGQEISGIKINKLHKARKESIVDYTNKIGDSYYLNIEGRYYEVAGIAVNNEAGGYDSSIYFIGDHIENAKYYKDAESEFETTIMTGDESCMYAYGKNIV
jgi:energy-coupling factor transporter ATP-binding protein EcfA2